MDCKDKTYQSLTILIFIGVIVISAGQGSWKNAVVDDATKDQREKIIWCTTSKEEQKKCQNFSMAVERDQIRIGYTYFKLDCKHAFNKDECMRLLDEEKATLTTLDPGEVFVGGRFHSLIPISQEISEGGFKFHYSVAVVKKGTLTDLTSIRELRGKKGCFAGVGTMAGWVLPIYTLMKEGGLEIVDCNNHVKSATDFFGPSCAVNSLLEKYNPIGDNSDKLCGICIGKVPGGKCTDADPYAGFEGAFRCLLEAGDVAFLKHTTVSELLAAEEFSTVKKDGFELLCKDGRRQSVTEYRSCNWGTVPSNAIVTTSASSFEVRKKYQKFLERAVALYSQGVKYNTSLESTTNRYSQDDRSRYDIYGNRNRFKRQNYGNQNERNQFGQYNGYNTFGQNDANRPNQNQTFNNQNQFGQYNRFGQNEPNRANQTYNDPYARDPFSRDPYNINRDQYGINIDPYSSGSDVDNYNRDYDNRFNHTFPGFNPNNQTNTSYYEVFNLFESSPKYGIRANLIFQDSARGFASLNENLQTYSGYLGDSLNIIMGVRDCPVNRMTLCVTSDVELDKCVKMRTAVKAQLLKPEMSCFKAHSQIHCMQAIRSGSADVALFDAGDIYTAGLNYKLVPIISEVYNLGKPEYFVVAVAKEADASTELTYLRGKFTCHGGINTAAGWIYPLAFLLSNGWIRPYGCNSLRAAAEYFTKSCVPGALSTEYNTGVPYDNMCDLCHGNSFRYCRRDASEVYFGHTGAFRCLVEGGGHVAFVKHTTVAENTGGNRREWWARDALADDFELLCPDGTRAEIQDYLKCNLGKVKANAVVTRGGYSYNETEINAYINLFMYAQNFYGRKNPDEFSFGMFTSMEPYTDLIFQDATQQLQVIKPEQRYYSEYLGPDFMRARRVVDCHAGATNLFVSLFVLILPLVVFLCK